METIYYLSELQHLLRSEELSLINIDEHRKVIPIHVFQHGEYIIRFSDAYSWNRRAYSRSQFVGPWISVSIAGLRTQCGTLLFVRSYECCTIWVVLVVSVGPKKATYSALNFLNLAFKGGVLLPLPLGVVGESCSILSRIVQWLVWMNQIVMM